MKTLINMKTPEWGNGDGFVDVIFTEKGDFGRTEKFIQYGSYLGAGKIMLKYTRNVSDFPPVFFEISKEIYQKLDEVKTWKEYCNIIENKGLLF